MRISPSQGRYYIGQHTQNNRRQTFMHRVGSEPMTNVNEVESIFRDLNLAKILIGHDISLLSIYTSILLPLFRLRVKY
jgi:hypothetical protein